MDFKEVGRKIENLGTFIAFTIQGTYKHKDGIPPMPEPTQQVGWKPEELARLASGGEQKKR